MSLFDEMAEIIEPYFKGSEIEGIQLAAYLKSRWVKAIKPFIAETLDALENTDLKFLHEVLAEITSWYREDLEEDFIDDAEIEVEKYVESAYELGLVYQVVTNKDDVPGAEDDIVDALNKATLSSKKNVVRTIKRWFRQTQGKYFERFIIPKLATLEEKILATSPDERVTTLNKLGRDYKKFCKADGYWDSVSHLNTATATVIGQIDNMAYFKVTHYQIHAVFDEATCPVCAQIDGAVFSVQQALDYKVSLLGVEDAEEIRNLYPWPREKDLAEYPDPSQSPYVLPPYHPSCRCYLTSYS